MLACLDSSELGQARSTEDAEPKGKALGGRFFVSLRERERLLDPSEEPYNDDEGVR